MDTRAPCPSPVLFTAKPSAAAIRVFADSVAVGLLSVQLKVLAPVSKKPASR